MSRQREPFDWDLVESLVIAEASEQLIAERLLALEKKEANFKSIQAKIKLIQRRIKERFNCSFVQWREQKLDYKKMKLRQRMWEAVDKGNVTAMIWLSKQYLGFTEKQEISGNNSQPIQIAYIPKSHRTE